MSVAAAYFDGRTSQSRAVTLRAQAGELAVDGDGVQRRARPGDVEVSAALGSAPRTVRFADGAFCEVRDVAGLGRVLAELGYRESAVARWQGSFAIALGSAIAVCVLLALGYAYGLPWAAREVAERLPPEVDRELSAGVLRALDDGLLRDSTVPVERRRALRSGFAALKVPAGTRARIDLRFGAIPMVGANAFALPDGTVVLLDDLTLLCSDAELHAVLAHELGHVHHRHGERLLLQGTLAGVIAAWWMGDLSGLLATAPAALLQARYSRGFETEADAYAAALLKANGLSPALLADALEKLAKAHGKRHDGERGWGDYLSSHPAPATRLEALRRE